MNVYHPPQRAVSAWVLSVARWVRCTFHLPRLHAFDAYLHQGREFLPLTGVALGPGAPLPFLALRASAAHVVVPDAEEGQLGLPPIQETEPRAVSVYLEHVAVHGALHLLPGIRTSDFFAHPQGYVVLRGCRLAPAVGAIAEPVPVVFVNAHAIVAVAEEGGAVAIGDPAPAPPARAAGFVPAR